MRVFKVDVQEREGDKTNFDLIFKSQTELAQFIANLDMDKYDLTWVDTLENYSENTTEFLKKAPGLETGTK
jgi:hypothetical protein